MSNRASPVVSMLLGLLLVVSAVPAAGANEPTPEQLHADPSHSPDHVLVKVAPNGNAARVLNAEGEPVIDRWRRVPVPPGRTAAEFAAELASLPGVEHAEVDAVIQLDPLTPVPLGHVAPVSVNDPFHSLQWHFPAIRLDEGWAESTGAGVVVAVLDTGISQGGQDLDCHTFVSPYNAITATPGASAANDNHGHGTHVAGTVAQCTNNGVGVAGVAFNARLMPVKVLNTAGSGQMSHLAAGIDWARTRGANVINLSLGCQGCTSTIVNEAIKAAVAEGIVVVAASGNENSATVSYPASHPDVIAVGATDFNNQRAPYSNRGSALDLVAPGGDLDQDANEDGQPDGVLQETFDNGFWNYYWSAGTSMAAPHVSGAAALLLSVSSGSTPATIRDALTSTALDLGAPGRDNTYGHGLLQVHDALGYDLIGPEWPAGSELKVTRYGETSLTLSWSAATDNVGVTGYRLTGANTTVDTTGRQASVTGLLPGTQYEFEVLARDAAGNWSEPLGATVRTARRFTDTQGHLFYNDVLWMSGTDVTRGCNPPVNDLYCPDDFVTRGQLAAFLVRALGLTADTHPGFVDVPSSSTFARDIGRLATEGITRGCNPPVNDRFCPEDFVTRGQLAAFFHRALR